MDEALRNELRKKLQQPKPKQDLVVERCKIVEVTAEDLMAAIRITPDHPVAVAFLKNIEGANPETKYYVDSADLEALLENKQVKRRCVINKDGFQEITKYVEGNVPPSTPQEDSPATAPGESSEDSQE